MISRLFLCSKDGEHHYINAVKTHNDSCNNQEQANLKHIRVEGMPGVLKSLEEHYGG